MSQSAAVVPPWEMTDPLGEALHVLRLRGTYYTQCEFSAPWGLDLPAFADSLMFHLVTAGECWLEVEGAPPCPLQAGDLGLVPHGAGHRIVSSPGERATGLFDLIHEESGEHYEIIRLNGGGEAAKLLCGTVHLEHPAAKHLTRLLPSVISVHEWSAPEQEWIASTIAYIAAETHGPRPGGEAIITRLADILVIQAIRSWLEQDPSARTGWLGALRDQQIGHAMTMVHRDPARSWTVASLAAEVAMSRSAFSARFTELVGEPPMTYVARWRMQLAVNWLRQENATLAELALRLGYASEAAFSRAFKRFLGVSPGAMRRDATAWGFEPQAQAESA